MPEIDNEIIDNLSLVVDLYMAAKWILDLREKGGKDKDEFDEAVLVLEDAVDSVGEYIIDDDKEA